MTRLKHTPRWLKKRIVSSERLFETKRLLKDLAIKTVCESSLCPNLNECFSEKKVTFLISGGICTRRCGFCSVDKEVPGPIDKYEPRRIADTVRSLGLEYVVVTSVTRDDLEDGGADQFAKVIAAVRGVSKEIKVEVLVPDFVGRKESVFKVLAAGPDIFGHNIETAERLYQVARPGSDYQRSIDLLKSVKKENPSQLTKSGMMVGLGEVEEEIVDTMRDLSSAGCDILTIGQYLRPGIGNLAIDRFAPPEEFDRYKIVGARLGFKYVSSGPFVRSSYSAAEAYKETAVTRTY